MPLDFKGLASNLLARHWELLPAWLPGGKMQGKEYCCGSIQGGDGQSFRVNTADGVWKEFGQGEPLGGGDLISLYAAINGLEMGKAFHELEVRHGSVAVAPVKTSQPKTQLILPPEGSFPNMRHETCGEPVASWCYRTPSGAPIYYVARYQTPTNGVPGKKFFTPFSFDGSEWVKRSPDSPRPLYGLELLQARPESAALVVEGEGKCEVARRLFGEAYVAVAWPNGANSVDKCDWKPLYGRRILLWPDNNDVGRNAMQAIAAILHGHVPEIKIVDVSDLPPDHDLGDCSTWNSDEAFEWTRPRVSVWGGAEPAPVTQIDTLNTPNTTAASAPMPLVIKRDAAKIAQEAAGVTTGDKGAPFMNADNVLKMLENCPEFKEQIWFDEFFNRAYTNINGSVKPWKDAYDSTILTGLQRHYGFYHATKGMVRDAMEQYLLLHRKNSVKEWLDSLAWDRIPRVVNFFRDMYGSAQPEPYLSAVSKNFWVSMVARVMQPGCKADHMVILEGDQGAFKSSSLAAIGGDWFAEIHEDMGGKDFALSLQGKLIVEIAELESFKKASDVTIIKKTLSCQVDRVRAPYGRTHEDLPRQCILVGSTNEEEYLRDATGNRRYWPIKCEKIDLSAIRLLREQLFAEAVDLYRGGANWHEVPKTETQDEQKERQQPPACKDAVENWLAKRDHNPEFWTTPHEIAKDCLKIEARDLKPYDLDQIKQSLKLCSWTSGHPVWDKENRKTVKAWRKPGLL